jgi:hypothetical protein
MIVGHKELSFSFPADIDRPSEQSKIITVEILERAAEVLTAWAQRRGSGEMELPGGHHCVVMIDEKPRRALSVVLKVDMTGLDRARTEEALLAFLQGAGIETAGDCKTESVFSSGSQGAHRTLMVSEEIFWLPDARHTQQGSGGRFEILPLHEFREGRSQQRFVRVPVHN